MESSTVHALTYDKPDLSIRPLSFEILSEIFHQAICEHVNNRPEALTHLSLVCRFWNDVVQQSPALWTVLNSGSPASFIRKSLQRSQTLPLEAYLFGDHDIPSFHSLVAPSAHRIRSVSYGGCHLDTLRPFLLTSVNLDVMYCDDSDEEDEDEIEDAGEKQSEGGNEGENIDEGDDEGGADEDAEDDDNEDDEGDDNEDDEDNDNEEDDDDDTYGMLEIESGPPIETLRLQNLFVNIWNWDRLTNLRVLNLIMITTDAPLLFSHLLAAIVASKGLQELQLDQLGPDDSNEDGDSPQCPPFELPLLHTLKLVDQVSPTFADPFLSSLSAPICRTIWVTQNLENDITFDWLSRTVGILIRRASHIILRLRIGWLIPLFYIGKPSGPTLNVTVGARQYECAHILSRYAELLRTAGWPGSVTLRLSDAHPPLVHEWVDITLGELHAIGEAIEQWAPVD